MNDVTRTASGTVMNLMAAGEPIGDDVRVGLSLAHRRQERKFSHGTGDSFCLHPVSKGTGHTTAARLDGLQVDVRDQSKRTLNGIHGCKCFLMAVTVEKDRLIDRFEPLGKPAGVFLPHKELLQKHGALADLLSVIAGYHGWHFVAKRKKAAWLQADDRHGSLCERRQSVDQSMRLATRLIDQTG